MKLRYNLNIHLKHIYRKFHYKISIILKVMKKLNRSARNVTITISGFYYMYIWIYECLCKFVYMTIFIREARSQQQQRVFFYNVNTRKHYLLLGWFTTFVGFRSRGTNYQRKIWKFRIRSSNTSVWTFYLLTVILEMNWCGQRNLLRRWYSMAAVLKANCKLCGSQVIWTIQ